MASGTTKGRGDWEEVRKGAVKAVAGGGGGGDVLNSSIPNDEKCFCVIPGLPGAAAVVVLYFHGLLTLN